MMNDKMKVLETIGNLRFDLQMYREEENWYMVAQVRLEIARLEALLGETY